MGKTTTSIQNTTNTTSNIGAAQRPFYDIGMQKAAGQLNTPFIPYGYTQNAAGQVVRAINPATGQPVANDRIAGFTNQQRNVQGQIAEMQTPGQFGTATNLATVAGVGALNSGNYDPAAQYQAGSYNPAAQYQGGDYGPAAQYQGGDYGPAVQYQAGSYGPAVQYQGANYGPAASYDPTKFTSQQIQDQNLTRYQMADAEQFGNAQAQQYMNPYIQNVVDVQKRKAQEDAQKSQLMQNLGASRQGTYGGSRQLLAGLNRERDLGRQMGDIQATGLQSAYANAQEQFERDRAAGMSVKDANLKAQLSVQDLEARNNLQSRMANQQYDFEAQKAGEASRQFGADFGEKSRQFGADLNERSRQFGADLGEKSRQFGADFGERSRLEGAKLGEASRQFGADFGERSRLEGAKLGEASRQFGADFGEKSRQFGTEFGERSRLDAAKFGEASRQFGADFNEKSRQFGADLGLRGYQTAGDMAQKLANIGSAQSQSDQARLNMQQSSAAQQQELDQKFYDMNYNDFLEQREDPYKQLQRYMNLMSGVPQATQTTTTQSSPSPSLASQIMGTGLSAASIYNTANRAGVI